jgi:hypothetical protein
MTAIGIQVKMIRCDNAKEQMAPLKDMCWANGVLHHIYTATSFKVT